MGVLNVADIKAQRQEELRLAEECALWCAQAANEFAAAAREIGTPLQGMNAQLDPPVARNAPRR